MHPKDKGGETNEGKRWRGRGVDALRWWAASLHDLAFFWNINDTKKHTRRKVVKYVYVQSLQESAVAPEQTAAHSTGRLIKTPFMPAQNNGSLKARARLRRAAPEKIKIRLLKMKGKPLPCLNCQNNQSDCQRRLQPLQVRGQHASRHKASN